MYVIVIFTNNLQINKKTQFDVLLDFIKAGHDYPTSLLKI